MVVVSGMLPACRVNGTDVTTGGALTWRVAEVALPVPPLVEVTVLVLLTCGPETVPRTWTVKLQVVPTGMVAPEMVSELLPAVGANVPVAQLLVAPGEV